jgi:hypothetical protein
MLALVACALVVLGAYAVVLRATWRSVAAARLMAHGRYAEARIAAERLATSPFRLLPSIRHAAGYTAASALHLSGDLEGALAALAALRTDRLPPPMRYAVATLEASTLILLRRSPERAEALLAEAATIQVAPEDCLLRALAARARGDDAAAARLFADAGTARPRTSALAFPDDGRHQEAIFHTLRGLYLVEVGAASEAARDLVVAARSPLSNVYTERARAFAAADPETEGPSSLAPVVAE